MQHDLLRKSKARGSNHHPSTAPVFRILSKGITMSLEERRLQYNKGICLLHCDVSHVFWKTASHFFA